MTSTPPPRRPATRRTRPAPATSAAADVPATTASAPVPEPAPAAAPDPAAAAAVAEPTTPAAPAKAAPTRRSRKAAATPAKAVASAEAAAAGTGGTPAVPAGRAPIGRIPVVDVSPVVEAGRWPAKAAVGEAVPIRATVFREGHDACAATAVLVGPDGTDRARATMVDIAPGLDRYEARLVPDEPGAWGFRVEGWSDPYGTWQHDAPLKVGAGVDVDLVLEEGARLLERAAARDADDAGAPVPEAERQVLRDAVTALRDAGRPAEARLAAGLADEVVAAMAAHPVRELLSPSPVYPLVVDRPLALAGAWYEIFPRSIGATYDDATGTWSTGTLRTAAEDLPRIAGLGFDVVYLTPIHPIGTTHRKGRNNTLDARPGDPGSPYAIGSPDGGHDAIDPSLGTFEDFDAFVAQARAQGLEVALDLALQCSPDHPWVTEHPEWFTTRLDGTIAYAENPPKKYQDIYPLNFDNDPEGIYAEIRRVLQVWIDHGVTAFRVDNPHTKPLSFWERILADVRATHPEVVFLSEAFTRPAMMLNLARVGFHQSYTYFTWRNTKEEVEEYLAEVSGEQGSWMRPSFWPTTHDILTPYMQTGGTAGFAVRAVLAALGAPTWGIYSGYELVEDVPRPGVEEQIDNEKYEFKPRDWAAGEPLGIARLLRSLNQIRRAHPALLQLRNLTVHPTSDPSLVAFSRHLPAHLSPSGAADTVVVVVNLDPRAAHDGVVDLDLEALGLEPGTRFVAHDVLSQEVYAWDDHPWVRLDPYSRVAHVVVVERV